MFFDYMEAVTHKDNSIELSRKGYWPAMAAQFLDEEKYSRAVDLCRRMLESEPEIISGRVILARSLYHAGEYKQAREQFSQILREDASNLVALKYLGDLLFREGEEAAALAHYRRVLEIDPCCRGLVCPVERAEEVRMRQLTIKRAAEQVVKRDKAPLSEPAFLTETIGDIYQDQGYFRLAEKVYSRLLAERDNNRIAGKLRDIKDKLGKKEKSA